MENKFKSMPSQSDPPHTFSMAIKEEICQPGGPELSDKGCYRHLCSRSESMHLHHFHHPEEGWGEKVSGRHVRTESVGRVSSIQDG